MKKTFRLAASLVLFAGIAGCEPLGDGSTVEKLEIIPVNSDTQLRFFEQGDTYKVFQCFRDELLLLATFTDGSTANFSYRGDWSTSDASIIEVSNNDIPAVLLGDPDSSDGAYYEHPSIKYAPGTVIPHGTPGQEAVVTAKFAGLSASIRLQIRKPSLQIVAVPYDAAASADPVYLGEGTEQRLTMLADVGGRTVPVSDLVNGATNGVTLNPIRWTFPDGTFEARDPDNAGDFDKWIIEDGERIATLNASTGRLFGVNADSAPHEIAGEQQLCEGSADLALRPVSHVRVAAFQNVTDRLVLSHEANFNGAGFEARDLVIGTSQQLQLAGKLDVEGDGDPIVPQDLKQIVQYQVLPLDAGCEDNDALLGCVSNNDFFAGAFGLVQTTSEADEGDVARIHACLPFCLAPLATLSSDAAYPVASGTPVNFTAAAIDPPAGITVQYRFDFGDGTTPVLQADPTASHAYAADGTYTATVRLVDAAFPDEFLSQNAGAVRLLVGTSAPANTAPVAQLDVTLGSGNAPLSNRLVATSTDANSGDSATVYEFDPGDGSPVVRQTSNILIHAYKSAGTFTPSLRVYDESGLASAADTGVVVTVTGEGTAFYRSNAVEFRARDATLCALEIQPPLASAPTEDAFTFPGARFQATGSYVLNTASDACTDPVIGVQDISRLVTWILRPEGVTDEFADFAALRDTTDDFRVDGQIFYFQNVDAPTTLDVTATLGDPYEDIEAVGSQITVTPCSGCTP